MAPPVVRGRVPGRAGRSPALDSWVCESSTSERLTARPPLDEPEFSRWREEADRALGGATREAGAANHNWSCFLAEQAPQLAMKALLHGLGRAPWGHDLEELTRAVGQAGVELPDEVTAAARQLARHYIPARYPDAHPAASPGSRYVADDAAGALQAANALLEFVDRTWESLG
jgi:HEPN domain-containing protein